MQQAFVAQLDGSGFDTQQPPQRCVGPSAHVRRVALKHTFCCLAMAKGADACLGAQGAGDQRSPSLCSASGQCAGRQAECQKVCPPGEEGTEGTGRMSDRL